MTDAQSIASMLASDESTFTSAEDDFTIPPITFGGPITNTDAAPPDLRLRAHPMKLTYTDDRINDPQVRQWMEDRRLGVGASEIAVLFNLSPWQNIQELWTEKVNGCSYEAGNELFHFGHAMEPLIAQEFAQRSGETVGMPPEMIMVGSKPHHRASLDRVILEDSTPVAALELKNLNESRFSEYMKCGPSVGYLLQLQYQMAVAGMDYGYLAVLFGGQRFAAWRVVASPSVQREILRRVDLFWEFVESKTPPPDTFGGRNIGKSSEAVITLTDPSWETKMRELDDIRLQKAALDKTEKLLKAQIKEELGSFASARAGRMQASMSHSTRRSLDAARLKAAHPQLVADFTKESTVRTLRIKEIKS